jgi:hypothetical protein
VEKTQGILGVKGDNSIKFLYRNSTLTNLSNLYDPPLSGFIEDRLKLKEIPDVMPICLQFSSTF